MISSRIFLIITCEANLTSPSRTPRCTQRIYPSFELSGKHFQTIFLLTWLIPPAPSTRPTNNKTVPITANKTVYNCVLNWDDRLLSYLKVASSAKEAGCRRAATKKANREFHYLLVGPKLSDKLGGNEIFVVFSFSEEFKKSSLVFSISSLSKVLFTFWMLAGEIKMKF